MLSDAGSRVSRWIKGRLRRGMVTAAAVLVALVVGACGGGTSPTAAPTTAGSAPPSPVATGGPGGGTVNVFVDLVDCENVGGSGAASGTIENQSEQAAAYRIRVAFLDPDGAQLGEGTADTATAAAGAQVGWTVTAAGLGDAEVSCRTLDVTIIGDAGGPPQPSATGVAGEYPCTLVPQAEVEQLAGNALEPGDGDTINHDENGVQWTALECAWLSPPGPAVEVDLELTDATGFPSGSVGCPPLVGPASSVDGLGAPATWTWTDPGTEITVGTLRVCAPAALVDVRVGGPGGQAILRAVATGVATKVLAGL